MPSSHTPIIARLFVRIFCFHHLRLAALMLIHLPPSWTSSRARRLKQTPNAHAWPFFSRLIRGRRRRLRVGLRMGLRVGLYVGLFELRRGTRRWTPYSREWGELIFCRLGWAACRMPLGPWRLVCPRRDRVVGPARRGTIGRREPRAAGCQHVQRPARGPGLPGFISRIAQPRLPWVERRGKGRRLRIELHPRLKRPSHVPYAGRWRRVRWPGHPIQQEHHEVDRIPCRKPRAHGNCTRLPIVAQESKSIQPLEWVS